MHRPTDWNDLYVVSVVRNLVAFIAGYTN
jgi:hypothetical protein